MPTLEETLGPEQPTAPKEYTLEEIMGTEKPAAPREYSLEEVMGPGSVGPDGGEIPETLSFEDVVSPIDLPKIPEDISNITARQAKDLIKAYDLQGKDSGLEISYGFGVEGQREELVRRKSYIGKAGRRMLPEEASNLRNSLNELYAKENPENTHVFDQFVEGIVRPSEELVLGAMQIATGEQQPETTIAKPFVPYEKLNAQQKFGYIAGAFLGYAGPGGVINTLTKGFIHVGVRIAGKEALIREASKSTNKYIGKKVAANPTALRIVAGKYASKFFKNATALTAEGAIWGALESRGDIDQTIENAVIFPIIGPAAIVGAQAAGKAISKVLPKALVERKKYADKSRLEKAEDKQILEAMSDPKIDVVKSLLTLEKPMGITDEGFNKSKKLLSAKLSAEVEVSQRFEASKLIVKSNSYQKELGKISKELDLQMSNRTKVAKEISKNQPISIEETLPKEWNDLRVSFHTEEILKDTFGNFSSIPVNEKNLVDILRKTGLNQRQAMLVDRQLKTPQLRIRKLTPTATVDIKASDIVGNKQFKMTNDRIKQLENRKEQLTLKDQQTRLNPLFKEEADPAFSRLKPSELDELTKGVWADKVSRMGIDTTQFKLPAGRTLMNYTERYNRIEEQTAIPIGQIPMDLMDGINHKSHLKKAFADFKMDDTLDELRKIGADGDDIFDWMHYVYKDKSTGKVFWKPEAVNTPGYTLPKFEGKEPSGEVKELLFKLREMTYWSYDELVKSGAKPGYRENYVAYKTNFSAVKGMRRIRQEKLGKASLLKRRKRKGVLSEEDRELHITNFYDLMPRIVNDSINAASFTSSIDKINTVNWMLRASGRGGVADELLEYSTRAMGHKSKEETIEYLVAHAVDDNRQWLAHMISTSDAKGKDMVALHEDALRTATSLMYNSFIGLNPRILVKQITQPESVGAAEVGLQNIVFGQALAIGKKAMGKGMREWADDALKRVETRLYPEALDISMMSGPQRHWLKVLEKTLGVLGKPGMKAFEALDRLNRKTAFLGAKRQFDQAMKKRKVEKIMEDLLPSERSRVVGALVKKGLQEASDIYGLIRSKRINYAYNLAEKGEFFSKGAGQYIPFVHWTANQWMRHIENIRGKNYKTLGKRIGFGYAEAIAVGYIMNEKAYPTKVPTGFGTLEISSDMPQAALFGFMGMSPFTVATEGLKAEIFAPYRAYRKFIKPVSPGVKRMRKERSKDLHKVVTFKTKGKKKEKKSFKWKSFK